MPWVSAGVSGSVPLQCPSLDLAPSVTWLWKQEVDDFLAFYLFCTALPELPSLVGNLSVTCLFCLCTFHAQFHSAMIGQNLTAQLMGIHMGHSRWNSNFWDMTVSSLSGGEGDTPLYKLYRYVLPRQVGFLHRFGLKTGIHFWSGIEYGFWGS